MNLFKLCAIHFNAVQFLLFNFKSIYNVVLYCFLVLTTIYTSYTNTKFPWLHREFTEMQENQSLSGKCQKEKGFYPSRWGAILVVLFKENPAKKVQRVNQRQWWGHEKRRGKKGKEWDLTRNFKKGRLLQCHGKQLIKYTE